MLVDIRQQIRNKIKNSRLVIEVDYNKLTTIKKANDKLLEINQYINESKQVVCVRNGELDKMGILQDLTLKYNELVKTANKLGGDFLETKQLKCKVADAEKKIANIEAFIAENNKTIKTKEEKEMKGKNKETNKETNKEITVSFGHWQVLQMFKKDEMKLDKLNEIYTKETEKTRGLALIISQMVKKGFVEQYEEEGVKVVELTKTGKEAKATKEPEKPVKKERKKVEDFVAPYSDEQIKNAKKKKAKKMKAANEAAKAKYNEKISSSTRAANNYDGGIEKGRHQEELTAKASMRDRSKAAARDYFEANVTKDILMTKHQFIADLEKHGLTKTTAISIWKENTAEGCNSERLMLAESRAKDTVLPELKTKKEKKMKDKKEKSDKKDKKNKNDESSEKVKKDKKNKEEKKDKKEKSDKKDKKNKKDK